MTVTNNLCLNCKKSTKNKTHKNTKYCEPCRVLLRKRPIGRLTLKQEKMARRLAGTIYYEKLAKKIGISRSRFSRWARRNGVSLNAHKTKESCIKEVCSYYELNGRKATAKKFPNINIRSIVERYKSYKPRQVRWEFSKKLDAIRFSGFISDDAIAKYVNRPRAHAGSIKSLWCRHLNLPGYKSFHGLPENLSRVIALKSCPIYKYEFLKLALWVDLEKHLKPEVPEAIVNGVKALASFQRFLFNGKHPNEFIKEVFK